MQRKRLNSTKTCSLKSAKTVVNTWRAVRQLDWGDLSASSIARVLEDRQSQTSLSQIPGRGVLSLGDFGTWPCPLAPYRVFVDLKTRRRHLQIHPKARIIDD